MHKIIYSSYELDLTPFKITTVEENHWFSDQFFTKYSFPFDIKLIEALIKVFGNLLDDNNVVLETYFEVLYVEGNKIETAILEINSQKGLILNAKIRYGFDELPNWNKKLAELPLEVTAITDIYAHAKTIIPQTWPAVNYNYPQIHTDKYDTNEVTWANFKKIINNYDGTNFLANVYNEFYKVNSNIIQPLPYFLHILTVLFADAGYTLKGNVTTNVNFKKLCLFSDIDYFKNINGNSQTLVLKSSEYTHIDSDGFYNYAFQITLNKNSGYRVTGKVIFNNFFSGTFYPSEILIMYRNQAIFGRVAVSNSGLTEYNLDASFVTMDDDNSHTIDITAKMLLFSEETEILDISIQRVSLINIDGFEAPVVPEISEIKLYNEVDLTKVVPDITGGTFVSALKNWYNIDLTILGKDIYMNFIENEINYNDAEDLSNFEVLEPAKTFNNDVSFLLKFADVDSEAYKYDVIFQNKAGFEVSDKNVNKQTNTITIDALPLPQKYAEGVETAFAFDHGGNNKIYAVLYDGLNAAGLNLTDDITPILIPAVHHNHYKKWFNFRINAINYDWTFKMFSEKLEKIKKKVWAYGRYHVVKSMSKTQIDEDLYEVDIETHSMP
ncbi:MAG: hypothetical protein WC389_00010 [Lutibacter sp.]|jgi:hypothetical protein